jgi:hypothetical protein
VDDDEGIMNNKRLEGWRRWCLGLALGAGSLFMLWLFLPGDYFLRYILFVAFGAAVYSLFPSLR